MISTKHQKNWHYIMLGLVYLGCLWGMSSCAVAQTPEPQARNVIEENSTEQAPPAEDSTYTQLLTKLADSSLVATLFMADSIEAYLLDEWSTDTSAAVFEGFNVLQHMTTVDSLEQQTLLSLLQDPKSYFIPEDGSMKRCGFTPHLGFVIHNSIQPLKVLVATNCDFIQFNTENSQEALLIECDPSHGQWQELGQQLFSTNF
ncbi:MAG: hypothetical protein GY810_05185 [Aureispira sp.]|nr:hypothetical protein [Aureispira sp.]